ncbi:MAG: YbhB/YbcL family Raf kinase inhibitor-like protein [Anaerolineae bacterium]|jgi:hypothetical protein
MQESRLHLAAALLIVLAATCACAPAASPAPPSAAETSPESFQLTSPAFAQGETIPQRYTCDGQDISPPLSWTAPPEGTQSLALIMDDPDAPVGTWVHWVLFNVPVDKRSLSEAVPAKDQLPDGSLHGKNSWRRLEYGGPCPPSGGAHRYVFTLYALDTSLDVPAGADKRAVLKALEGHVLAETQLTGEYARQ